MSMPPETLPPHPRRPVVLSTQQAARYCAVDRRTMLRWVESGMIPGHRTPGGRWRIRRSDLVTFLRQRDMPVPEELDPGPARIVIVDDDPAHVDATRRYLESQLDEVEVRVAYDGFTAGMLVKERPPHLLLLDVLMPDLDGFEVCERVRADETLDGVAIYAVSSQMTPERAARLTELGADGCIDKKDLIPALATPIARLADGARSLR